MIIQETFEVTPDEQQHLFDRQKRWTRSDCDRFEARDWLPKYYELLDGQIVPKVGQGLLHGMCLTRVFFCLAQIWKNDQTLMRCLLEVAETDRPMNFPQPDVFVSARSALTYSENIRGADTLLVVEVADGTIDTDLTIKAALYARAQAPEYWALDLRGRKLYVHRFPDNGVYRKIRTYGEDESIAPLSAPHLSLGVSKMLPPERTEDGIDLGLRL